MTNNMNIRGNRRIIIVAMGVFFLCMAMVLLSQRLNNPSLTVQAPPSRTMPQDTEMDATGGMGGMEGMGAMGGMGGGGVLGKLMREVQQNPTNVPALMQLSEQLMHQQQWDAAQTFAQRAVVAAPNQAEPLLLLGAILHRKNDHASAAATLEQAITINDDPIARYNLGMLYIHYLKNPAKGIEHLTAGLHNEKTPPEIQRLIQEQLEAAPMPSDTPPPSTSAPKTAPKE